MSRDDDKKLVLARRAKFIAAAVASVGIACGKEQSEPPRPCLSVAYTGTPPDAEPMPCLSPMPMDTSDAAPIATSDASAPADAGAPDAADAGKKLVPAKPTATPMPCLSQRPPELPKK